MDAGLLNRRITLQSQSFAGDEFGLNSAPTFTTIATVWARVQPGGGNEQVQASQRQDIASVVFSIYYRSDINAASRIIYNGLNYNIINVSEIGYRHLLQLTAEVIR
jgi:SPP1 family predicted phage head-tail adaptor